MNALVPIRPVAWELAVEGVADGVRFALTVPDHKLAAEILLTRDEARAFARGLMAAAGDGTERTFPHPAIERS